MYQCRCIPTAEAHSEKNQNADPDSEACGDAVLRVSLRRRYLFPAGLFFLLLLYDLSGFIWNIEINGNSYLTTETILDFLEEEHASFGTKKSRISCEDLEEAMRSRYRDVIWTSIKIMVQR